MENFDINNTPQRNDNPEPIPFNQTDPGSANVSHTPLNLSGGDTKEAPKIEVAKPVAEERAEGIASSDRITGVRTFFTKSHAGSIDFLSEQIINWLKNNPDIRIKRTNMATGDIVGKKTEPNILITVWY